MTTERGMKPLVTTAMMRLKKELVPKEKRRERKETHRKL